MDWDDYYTNIVERTINKGNRIQQLKRPKLRIRKNHDLHSTELQAQRYLVLNPLPPHAVDDSSCLPHMAAGNSYLSYTTAVAVLDRLAHEELGWSDTNDINLTQSLWGRGFLLDKSILQKNSVDFSHRI